MKLKIVDFYAKVAGLNKFPVALFFCLLLLMVFNTILSIPITQRVSEVMFSSMNLPIEQMDMMAAMAEKINYISIVTTLFTGSVYIFFSTLILHLLCKIFHVAITYWSVMTIFIVAALFSTIDEIINTVITLIKGLEQIGSQYDLYHTGLNILTSVEKIGIAGYMFLSHINILQLLFVIALTIGLKIVGHISKRKAAIIAIIFWLLLIVFIIVMLSASSMTTNFSR